MALIACPECRNRVSDKAKICPRCGYSVAAEKRKETYKEAYKGIISDASKSTGQLFIRSKEWVDSHPEVVAGFWKVLIRRIFGG